jgi:hypothetical protein
MAGTDGSQRLFERPIAALKRSAIAGEGTPIYAYERIAGRVPGIRKRSR